MLEVRVSEVSDDRLFSVNTLLVVTDFVPLPFLVVELEFIEGVLEEFTADDESFVLPVLAFLLLELPFSTNPALLLLDSFELRYSFVPADLLP